MTTQNLDACHRVADLYTQSCTELLHAYGLSESLERVEDRGPQSSESCYVSVLALTGEGVRLVSAMDVDVSLLRASYPASETSPSPQDLEDWCRELNNQLGGRLKNKLLQLGCKVMLGLPSLLTGIAITHVEQQDLDTRRIFFKSPAGNLTVTLASHIAPSVELADEPIAAGQEESSMLFEGGFQLF